MGEWGGEEKLGGTGEKTIIRIYCIKSIFKLKERKT